MIDDGDGGGRVSLPLGRGMDRRGPVGEITSEGEWEGENEVVVCVCRVLCERYRVRREN